MTYEDFKRANAAFGSYNIPSLHEEEMLKCYAIANQVAEDYAENYGHIEGPRIGDIVEFSDGFCVYEHGKIVENLYGGSKHGMLCVCESGSSFTDGKGFSTSGGAFEAIHRSKLQLVGEAENLVWTWGCYGAGGDQGIYFTLKVRKWRVPYDPTTLKRSKVTFYGRGRKRFDGGEFPAVAIEHFDGTMFYAEHFVSIGAFKAWADYVGYRYKDDGRGAFVKVSRQRIESKCFTTKDWQPPKGAKPIRHIFNGRVKDAWVVTTDDCIMYYWPNIYDPEHPEPRYGTPECEAEIREFWKRDGNPMGVAFSIHSS